MKELSLIKNRVVRGEVDQIIIIANSKQSGENLEKCLKEEFTDYKLSYKIITNFKMSIGISYDIKTVTILWGSWWKNKKMLEYVKDTLINIPGVRSLSSIEHRWLYDA